MKLEIMQRTELALRALFLIGAAEATVRAADLAPELHTTFRYLPQVLRPLVLAGWLHSEPGPTGGYRLVAPLDTRTMLELIEVIEGPTDTQVCVLKGGPCGVRDRCALHVPWTEARNALVRRLNEIPLSSISMGVE